MSEQSFDFELDCKGLLCPLPVIKTKQQIDSMTSGQVLKLLATDKGSVGDLQAFARQTGNELLSQSEVEGLFIHYLRKQ